MKRLKVCVYAICKNEERFVDAWARSMKEADLIVVTDTGSTDGTVEKLRAKGVVVHEELIRPWRFDVARNLSLFHVPKDVDICVCTDLDELFDPGWRKKLEKAWRSHKPAIKGKIKKTGRYLYNWSFKPDGTPDVQFYYFKVHEREGFRWKCPIHEYVEYIGEEPLETVYIDGMVLSHYPDQTKSRGSYLSLLEMAVEEEPNDTRMRYYLGREYMYTAQWEKCISTLKGHLEMPTSLWKDERCASMRWIAASCHQLNRITEAYSWYYKAIAEQPAMREPFVEFARFCLAQKNWSMVYFLTKEALKISEQSKTFVNMGYAWDNTTDDLCALGAYYMGLYAEAEHHGKKALEYAPMDARLIKNLKMIQEKLGDKG